MIPTLPYDSVRFLLRLHFACIYGFNLEECWTLGVLAYFHQIVVSMKCSSSNLNVGDLVIATTPTYPAQKVLKRITGLVCITRKRELGISKRLL